MNRIVVGILAGLIPAMTACAAAEIAVQTSQPAVPMLMGEPDNIALRAVVRVPEGIPAQTLAGLWLTAEGTTDPADIVGITVRRANVKTDALVGKSGGDLRGRIHILCNVRLEPGEHTFEFVLTPKRVVNLHHRFRLNLSSLEFIGGKTLAVPPSAPLPPPLRAGVALRKAGDNNVKVYRIPGLAVSAQGTLLAVYDIRHTGGGDLPADIDVGLSRSLDGGHTWQPMQTIMDMGAPQPKNGIGDPAILVDRQTGRIWVAALWSKGNNGFHGSGPGLTPDETGQLVLTYSDNDGRSWSTPASITPQVKDPKWMLLFQGPGNGISMRNGTLVFPAQFRDAKGMPHSTILYSADHGKTWKVGTGAKANTTEAAVVELQDGSLMLNMRDNRGGTRSIAVTKDLGKTWTEHPTSRKALPEPVCMASLVRWDTVLNGARQSWLAFSNPNVAKAPRRNLTVKLSPDDGATWPTERQVLLDEGNSAGYSCLAPLNDHVIGILYEGSRAHLTFQLLDIADFFPATP